ncbi:type VI secretion system baseplate subunit TssK, partial [Vibrio parahaemolyticus]
MFLRPQHFQQHERAISNEYKGLHSLGGSYNWGVWNCRVKEHALKTGLIELDNLQAILPDMTLIDFSATTSFLSPLKVKKGTENTLVKVIVPLSKVSSKMIADPSETTVSRYLLQDLDVIDNLTGQDEETIQVASLNIELKSSNEQLTGYIELPILKIKEVSTEGEVILD